MKTPEAMDRILAIAGLTALVITGSGCTVKEDRGPCPCYLQVSFADPEAAGPVLLLGWNGSTLFREKVRIEDCRPYWTKPVEKGVLTVSACKGIGRTVPEMHQITIPVHCQADSLYAGFEEVDATGDVAQVRMSLRKQFATIFLDIRKPAETVRACRFVVEGNTSGFDLLDYSPVPGPFRFIPEPEEGKDIVTFRVPRQADDSMQVTIQPGDGLEARFPLGEYIRQLGYNWKTEELQDIYVSIDLARGLVDVRVDEWEEGAEFPIIEI